MRDYLATEVEQPRDFPIGARVDMAFTPVCHLTTKRRQDFFGKVPRGRLNLRNGCTAARCQRELAWLHDVSAVLGMLMHFKTENGTQLVNVRRPRGVATSYPNSSCVARLVGGHVAGLPRREALPSRRIDGL